MEEEEEKKNPILIILFNIVGPFITIRYKQHVGLVQLLIARVCKYKFVVCCEEYEYLQTWPIDSVDIISEKECEFKVENCFKKFNGINDCTAYLINQFSIKNKEAIEITQNVLTNWIRDNQNMDPIKHILDITKLVEFEFVMNKRIVYF